MGVDLAIAYGLLGFEVPVSKQVFVQAHLRTMAGSTVATVIGPYFSPGTRNCPVSYFYGGSVDYIAPRVKASCLKRVQHCNLLRTSKPDVLGLVSLVHANCNNPVAFIDFIELLEVSRKY